jgi:hypothetical protein
MFAANTPVMINYIVRYVDMQYVSIGARTQDNNFVNQRFDILNGAVHTQVTPSEIHAAGIRELAPGVFHIWAAINSGATQDLDFRPRLQSVNPEGTTQNYTGTNRKVNFVAVWVEENAPTPRTWVPTTTSNATRRADRGRLHRLLFANDFTLTVTVTGRDWSKYIADGAWRNILQAGDLNIYCCDSGIQAAISGQGVSVTDPVVMAEETEYVIEVVKDATTGLTLTVNENTPVNNATANALADIPNLGYIYLGCNANEQNHANLYYKAFKLDGSAAPPGPSWDNDLTVGTNGTGTYGYRVSPAYGTLSPTTISTGQAVERFTTNSGNNALQLRLGVAGDEQIETATTVNVEVEGYGTVAFSWFGASLYYGATDAGLTSHLVAEDGNTLGMNFTW